ncbi:MAG: hypothetical protein DRI71_09075 [Bacteroidetes bacterium]|nr:MAG: hypothetical protein DRI71_09075 [Bacteroidota bacterium]
MKTIIKSHSKSAVSMKLIAFFAWFIYIVIAIANTILIEAFLFSVAFVIISYLIFGKKQQKNYGFASTDNDTLEQKSTPHSHNYLSVFFHNAS